MAHLARAKMDRPLATMELAMATMELAMAMATMELAMALARLPKRMEIDLASPDPEGGETRAAGDETGATRRDRDPGEVESQDPEEDE